MSKVDNFESKMQVFSTVVYSVTGITGLLLLATTARLFCTKMYPIILVAILCLGSQVSTVLLVYYDSVFVTTFIEMYIEYAIALEPALFPKLLRKVWYTETSQIILSNIAHMAFALSYLSLSYKLTKFSQGKTEGRNLLFYFAMTLIMMISIGIVTFYRAEVYFQFQYRWEG